MSPISESTTVPDFTVVASVGTYHFAFDRLADWLQDWLDPSATRLIFQHGSTRPVDGAFNAAIFGAQELLDHYAMADAVVLQGGAGGVMDARHAGRIPIVVPREPVDNEVVDDHQVRLAERLAAMGIVHLARSRQELHRLLDGVRDGSVQTRITTLGGHDAAYRAVDHLHGLDASGPRRRGGSFARVLRHLAVRLSLPRVTGLGFTLAGAAAAVAIVGGSASVNALAIGLSLILGALPLTVPTSSHWPRSLWPAAVQVALGGGAVGLLAASQVVGSGISQALALALIGGAIGSLVWAVADFVRIRRGAVLLVGPAADVEATRRSWRVDGIHVVDTVTWPIEPDSAPSHGSASTVRVKIPSAVVPEVLQAVRRHGVTRVAFLASCDINDSAVRALAVHLSRRAVECIDLGREGVTASALRTWGAHRVHWSEAEAAPESATGTEPGSDHAADEIGSRTA